MGKLTHKKKYEQTVMWRQAEHVRWEISKKCLSKLSDSEDSRFVYDRHEKCGKQGEGSVNQRRRHHAAGIKEQAKVVA